MIKQQYYTRYKRGIYSKTPGYDTIAKSKGLSDEFIKEILHNYCFYDAPLELINEKKIENYPKALTCININTEEMIIGCSSFSGKDYTGERDTYFTQNYVISKEDKEFYIKNIERIIYAETNDINLIDCDKLYDNMKISKEIDGVLDEIKEIPMKYDENVFSTKDELLNKLNIDECVFKNIVKACFLSVLKNKKVYIILDVDVSVLSKYAKGLLEYIYRLLPYEVRRKLGFITYVKEPKSKEYINIQFVAKGGMNRITTEISAGYIFDFAQKNFSIHDINEINSVYIDFAWDNLEKSEKLIEFMDMADGILDKNSFSIGDYDKVYCLFLELNKNTQEQDISNLNKTSNNDLKLESSEDFVIKFIKSIREASTDKSINILEKQFLKLEKENIFEVKSKVCEYYKNNICEKNYRKIMIGFIGIADSKEKYSYDFNELLKYIVEFNGVSEARKYIVWYANKLSEKWEEEVFSNFKIAFEKYILKFDKDLFKDKEAIYKLLNCYNEEFSDYIKILNIEKAKGLEKVILNLKYKFKKIDKYENL